MPCKANTSLSYKVSRLVGINHLRTWKTLFVYFVKCVTFQVLAICFLYFELNFSLYLGHFFFFYLGHSLSCIDLRRTTDFLCVRILCIIFNKHMFNWIFKVPFYKTSTLFVLMAPHNNSGTEFIPPAKRNFFFFF